MNFRYVDVDDFVKLLVIIIDDKVHDGVHHLHASSVNDSYRSIGIVMVCMHDVYSPIILLDHNISNSFVFHCSDVDHTILVSIGMQNVVEIVYVEVFNLIDRGSSSVDHYFDLVLVHVSLVLVKRSFRHRSKVVGSSGSNFHVIDDNNDS